MKKIIFILMFMIISSVFQVCLADDTAILGTDLSITLPNFFYQEVKYNYKAVFGYNSNGTWSLISLTPIKPTQDVDDYGSNESSVLEEINKYRANGAPCSAGGLSPVSWDQKLTDAALGHSIDMAANNYFDHYSLNGDSPWDRISAAGFTGQPTGENIAAGYSVKNVVAGWINSPGHCSNIMKSSANVIGYGWASKSTSDWGTYHTLTIGIK